MPTAILKPSAIAFIQNFTPNNVAYLQDSPSAVDANHLVASIITAGKPAVVNLTFDIVGELTGVQTINLHYVDSNWVGLHAEVWQNGVKKHTTATVYTGYNNLVTSFNFDASLLSDLTGAGLVISVIGHYYNGLTINSLKAVELVTTYVIPEPTPEEIMSGVKINWAPTDYYNYEDLNRVEKVTEMVNEQILYMRSIDTSPEIIDNRGETAIEFANDFDRIERNILRLKQTFPDMTRFNPSKTNWFHGNVFDYTDANRLEQDLSDMYYFFKRNIEALPYTGQYIAGQEGVY